MLWDANSLVRMRKPSANVCCKVRIPKCEFQSANVVHCDRLLVVGRAPHNSRPSSVTKQPSPSCLVSSASTFALFSFHCLSFIRIAFHCLLILRLFVIAFYCSKQEVPSSNSEACQQVTYLSSHFLQPTLASTFFDAPFPRRLYVPLLFIAFDRRRICFM